MYNGMRNHEADQAEAAMSLIIAGRERDLGGFAVRRLLPHAGLQMVGPFIFFDHIGPAAFAPGTGIDVRPHPHIALATVTYLFSGALLHRDSLGSVQEIRPGDVNWMTAGSGIVHSERTPPRQRAQRSQIHGIQSWVALPDGFEDAPPGFAHHPSATLPHRSTDGVDITVVAGEAFGLRSPVTTLWRTLYVDAHLAAGAALDMPTEYAERAVYVVSGGVRLGGEEVAPGQLAVLDAGAAVRLQADQESRLMLLGGERFPTPRHIWWNFVASTQDRIEAAKARWAAQQFPTVPGETEFIPLPTN
jgi:redox-sensitive bicupin YhaK (pirin superfamily)